MFPSPRAIFIVTALPAAPARRNKVLNISLAQHRTASQPAPHPTYAAIHPPRNVHTMNSLRTLSRASCRSSLLSHFARALTTSTSLPIPAKPKAKTALPVSAAQAGSVLKGINYIKGRDDPVAKAEEEYPEWLWKCLETEKKGGEEGAIEGDEFCAYIPAWWPAIRPWKLRRWREANWGCFV